MSKAKISFFCQNCGYESVKWAGQCPSCGEWNTFVEELVNKENSKETQDWNNYTEEKRSARTTRLHHRKKQRGRIPHIRLPAFRSRLFAGSHEVLAPGK